MRFPSGRRPLAALLLAPLLLAAGAPAASGHAVAVRSADGADRRMDARITESSGLAVSVLHDGVLWTHDDSGHGPVLYALARDGRIAGRLRLQGVGDVDWEAMAAFRDADGSALLAVGDLGDNEARRASVEVDVAAEPARLRADQARRPLLRLRLRYPDGPRDAEALVVDTARRRMFVVTKGLFSGEVFAVPASAWSGAAPRAPSPARTATLVRVATVPLGLVTDAAAAPGGAVLVRTYGGLAAFAPLPVAPGERMLDPVARADLPRQRQGEGLALAPDGRTVLVSSEGAGEPVLRVDLPPDVRAAVSASPPSTASPGPATRRSPGPSSPAPAPTPRRTPGRTSGAGGGDSGLPWSALAVGGAVAALLVLRVTRRR